MARVRALCFRAHPASISGHDAGNAGRLGDVSIGDVSVCEGLWGGWGGRGEANRVRVGVDGSSRWSGCT